MAIKVGFLVYFTFFITFLSQVLSSTDSGDINWWCNKTPYPQLCINHLIGKENHSSTSMKKQEFQDLAIQVTMNQVVDALSHAKGLATKCYNSRQKAAWSDCLNLYESTILQLNQTLDNTNKYTDSDIQTWLSAAMTNLDTCQTGFIELGVSESILPLMPNNISELITNILAINAPSNEQLTCENEFPSSFSNKDRRILPLGRTGQSKYDIVVAEDRSGNFSTIKEALNSLARMRDKGRLVTIYVKRGVYNENVEITVNMKNVMMVGDGINNTIITGNRSHKAGFTTLGSATFAVLGKGFIARGITFRNTAGPESFQAVALVSRADHSVFYKCSFEGYQDTLYVHSNRQFYKECEIYGTVDFIFGDAAAVLQDCVIYSRARGEGKNVVAAQGRTMPNQRTGISIHNSRVVTRQKTYLGRPWQEYSRTVYLKTFLDTLVDPAGWLDWNGDVKSVYFGEYRNDGPGSSTKGRVKWGGYRVIKDEAEAEKFSVGKFICGQSWLPNTGVPFTLGLD